MIYDNCSECGKAIGYGEPYYCLDKHREVAHRLKEEDEVEVRHSELVAVYCTDCAKKKDFKDILVKDRKTCFGKQLAKLLMAKSSPLARIECFSGPDLIAGTGVFISRDGYLLTAKHVVDGFYSARSNEREKLKKNIKRGASKAYRARKMKEIERKLDEFDTLNVIPIGIGLGTKRTYNAVLDINNISLRADIAVLKVNAGIRSFPYLKINPDYIPALDEGVYSVTATHAPRHFLTAKCDISIVSNRVVAIEKQNRVGRAVLACETDYCPISGQSGGAILNSDAEVIGVISSSKLGDIHIAGARSGMKIELQMGLFYCLKTSGINFRKILSKGRK